MKGGLGVNPKDILGLTKPRLSLVPPPLMIYVARVMELGAKKYGPYNWRGNKVLATIYAEAAMRHLLAYLDGETLDPESGQPHTAHVAACMGILLDAEATGNLDDDRHTPGVAGRLITEMSVKSPGKKLVDGVSLGTVDQRIYTRRQYQMMPPDNAYKRNCGRWGRREDD